MAEEYRLVVLIAGGPHERMEGTYTSGPVDRALGMAAVSDLSKIPVLGIWELWGDNTRPVAAVMQERGHAETQWREVARSPWFDDLDWANEPLNGQPKPLVPTGWAVYSAAPLTSVWCDC